MSHRSGTRTRQRSLVGVALVSVLAVVAAACGSSKPSGSSGSSDTSPAPVGAQENVATSADWSFQMLNPDGTPLTVRDAGDGTKVNGYLVNNKMYQLQATVPAEVLASTTAIVLEVRTPDGVWDDSGILLALFDASGAPMRLPADASGTAKGAFGAGARFLGPHEFRLRAENKYPQQVVAYSNVYQATGFETLLDAVGTISDWTIKVVTKSGADLEIFKFDDGSEGPGVIVNKTYRVESKVPARFAGLQFNLERRLAGGSWAPLGPLSVDSSWLASRNYIADNTVGTFELRVVAANPNEASYTVVASSMPSSFHSLIMYGIKLVNNTSNNLNVNIPIRYVPNEKDPNKLGEWQYYEVALGQGEEKTLMYINPAPGASFSMMLRKQKCLVDCTDYFFDPGWAPDASGITPCGNRTMSTHSGGTYTVTLSDYLTVDGTTYTSGFKVGTFEGPIDGVGTAPTSCAFTFRTRLATWIRDHPVKSFLIVLGIVGILAASVYAAAAAPAILAVEAVTAAVTTGGATAAFVVVIDGAATALVVGLAVESVVAYVGFGSALLFVVGTSALITILMD